MRFEIGPGGGFVILVGLLGLSAGVFFLGMISGREMAQSEVSQNQLATAFPMPAVPAVAPSPAAVSAAAPATAAPAPPARPALASVGNVTNPAPAHAAASEHAAAAPERAAPPRRMLASTSPPHHAAPDRTAETAKTAAASTRPSGGHEERASAPPPEEHYHNYARAHRRGYNIVIDAAMDRAGANRMVSRLLALGYTPRIVPTPMNGQMWYKVQVGPYPTAEDARAAQTQLRAAYTARYVNRASAGGGSTANTDPAP